MPSLSEAPSGGASVFGSFLGDCKKGLAVRAKPPVAATAAMDMYTVPRCKSETVSSGTRNNGYVRAPHRKDETYSSNGYTPKSAILGITTAARSSGSKLPRHKGCGHSRGLGVTAATSTYYAKPTGALLAVFAGKPAPTTASRTLGVTHVGERLPHSQPQAQKPSINISHAQHPPQIPCPLAGDIGRKNSRIPGQLTPIRAIEPIHHQLGKRRRKHSIQRFEHHLAGIGH